MREITGNFVNFVKQGKNKQENSELRKSESERLVFWNLFNDILIKNGKPFNVREATTDHWYDVATGATIGIAATELTYLLKRKWLKSKNVDLSLALQSLDVTISW